MHKVYFNFKHRLMIFYMFQHLSKHYLHQDIGHFFSATYIGTTLEVTTILTSIIVDEFHLFLNI